MWPRIAAGIVAGLTVLGAASASAAAEDNLAFVDPTRTQSAIDQASNALTSVLSYEYRTLDANIEQARQKGTEQYARAHTDIVNKNRATATKQKQTVAVKVVGVGVKTLNPNSAQLLVFLDQTTTRGDTNKSATVGIAAIVEVRLLDGQWKLDSVSNTVS